MAKAKANPNADTRPGDPPAQTTKVKADPNGDIDQRMQALLEDHQRMGSRPK